MMSDDLHYINISRKQVLYTWILAQMARGAGWAAAFVIVLGLVLWAIYGVGLLLPAETRETPAPMGAVAVPLTTEVV
jgi:Intrinsic membrane protein PufX